MKATGVDRANTVVRRLARAGERVRTNVSLRRYTTFRVGGQADILYEPATLAELRLLAGLVPELPVTVIGRGSNVLVSEAGVRGVVVVLGKPFAWHRIGDSMMSAGGSSLLPHLAHLSARAGYSNAEFLAGIPGTLGGGVRMNAGAHGSELANVIDEVEVITLRSGVRRLLGPSELCFGPRSSAIGPGEVVVSARIKLQHEEPRTVRDRIAEYAHWRRVHQPTGFSAGSVFRNPAEIGISAGQLIEEAGLKGLRWGGARVSELHANWIITERGATADDVYRLILAVRSLVRSRLGVALHLELELLGEF